MALRKEKVVAIIDTLGEAVQCLKIQLLERGIALDACIIKDVPDTAKHGWYKIVAISKIDGAQVASSHSFRHLVTGSFIS